MGGGGLNCFNLAENWGLGWSSVAGPAASLQPGDAIVWALPDFLASPKNAGLRLPLPASTEALFLSYVTNSTLDPNLVAINQDALDITSWDGQPKARYWNSTKRIAHLRRGESFEKVSTPRRLSSAPHKTPPHPPPPAPAHPRQCFATAHYLDLPLQPQIRPPLAPPPSL